jgi:hypothetical protein
MALLSKIRHPHSVYDKVFIYVRCYETNAINLAQIFLLALR